MSQEVCPGDLANFSCSAVGSFVTISWQLNNSALLCDQSGCNNPMATVQMVNTSFIEKNQNVTIHSTLEINTEGLSNQMLVITCVMSQQSGDLVVQGATDPPKPFPSLLTVVGKDLS